jgi:hypothetical protein
MRGRVPQAAENRNKKKEHHLSEEVLQVVILGDGLLVGTEVFVPGTYTIGNSPEADLQLEDPGIGPEHAFLYFQNGKVVVQDNRSTGGIFVNGHKVNACEIRPVDEICCGLYVLKTRILVRRQHYSKPVAPEVAALLNGGPSDLEAPLSGSAQPTNQPALPPTPTQASSRKEQVKAEAPPRASALNGAPAKAKPEYRTMLSARQLVAAAKGVRQSVIATNGSERNSHIAHLQLPTQKNIESEPARRSSDPLRRARWLSFVLLGLIAGWFGYAVSSVPKPTQPKGFSLKNLLAAVVEGTVGRPSPRGVSIQGKVDREAVTKVVNAHLQEVRWCYKRALLKEPWLAGKVLLEWTTTVGGTVSTARIKSSTLRSSSTETCILQSLTAWQFPPVKAVISHPLLFNSVGY